jgi:hypothetical protein
VPLFFFLCKEQQAQKGKSAKQHIYKDTENTSHQKDNARDKAVASGLLKNQLAWPLEKRSS